MIRLFRNAETYYCDIDLPELVKYVIDCFLLHKIIQDHFVGKNSRREELRIGTAELVREFPCDLITLHIGTVHRTLADTAYNGNEHDVLELIVRFIGGNHVIECLPHCDADLVTLVKDIIEIVRRLAKEVRSRFSLGVKHTVFHYYDIL